MSRIFTSGFHDKIFHPKGFDFQQHCNSVGQYLRELRVTRNLSTADIGIICANMEADFLHSSIGATHSSYIRAMLESQKTPFRISLFNCPYHVVSAIVDWMYTGEIQVAPTEYGEYLKVVSNLGINKLQQNLESALQLLATQNNFLVHCINVATDPECLVSSVVRDIICAKFVAYMHTLSDNDIQKLTPNAVMTLVASTRIKSKEKIDTVNFALQWLKNAAHASFLDPVLGSMYIETLWANQLIALVQHLRRLYCQLPRNLLSPIHIYLRDRRVIVSGDPKKYAKTSNVIVPDVSTGASEPESERTSTEAGQLIGPEMSASHIAEIKQLPSFDDQIKIYRPTSIGSQEVINDRASEDLTEHRQSPDSFGKHRATQGREPQYSNIINLTTAAGLDKTVICYAFGSENLSEINNMPQFRSSSLSTGVSSDTRLAAAGTSNEKSAKTVGRRSFGSHSLADISDIPNQFSLSTDGTRTAEERTGGNALGVDRIDLQHSPTRRRSCETLNRRAFGPESVFEINRLPVLFSSRSRTSKYLRTPGAVANLSSPFTETINRYVYDAESVADITNLPKQFYGKKYYTPDTAHYPGGHRAIFNLTEQIRQSKEKRYGSDLHFKQGYRDFPCVENDWPNRHSSQESDLKTVNRYAFGEQSLADIHEIPSQFSSKHSESAKEGPPFEVSDHPSYGSESLADARTIPDQFSQKDFSNGYRALTSSRKVVNRHLLSAQSLSDIQTIPRQFLHRNGSLPKTPSQETINRRMFGTESLSDINALPEQFIRKAPLLAPDDRYAFSCEITTTKATSKPDSYQEWRRNLDKRNNLHFSSKETSENSTGSLIRERSFGSVHITDRNGLEDYKEEPYARYSASEIMDINAHPEFVREDHVIGKKALTREEYEELREIPPITDKDPHKLPVLNRYELTDEELDDIKNLPDIVGSQYTIGRRLQTEEEAQELQSIPEIQSASRDSDITLSAASQVCTRPSVRSLGKTGSALSSAYVASDMYSRRLESPVSSEYLMHAPCGSREKRMY